MASSDAQVGPAIARKVGEGFGRPDADTELPLDIIYTKLIDWLVSRQRLPTDWRKRLQVVHSAAAEAQRNLQPYISSQLLAQPGAASAGPDAPQLDYLRAREVLDLLAKGAEKNLFGYYTGDAGVWDKIVRAYESKDVWLGEASMTLIRNTDYEIPYFKKAAAKAGQQLQDLERRAAEYLRSAAAASGEYREECGRLGILGRDVRRELIALTQQLPALLGAAVEHIRSPALADAHEYYAAYTQHAHPQLSKGDVSSTPPGLLQTLADARDGQGPAASTEAGEAAKESAADQEGIEIAIDWGMDMSQLGGADSAARGSVGLATPVDISWDFDMPAEEPMATAENSTISWDIELDYPAAEEAAVGIDSEEINAGTSEGLDVDWDVQMEAADSDADQPGSADIDWDISPQQDSGGATTSASAVESKACEQVDDECTDSVVTGLIRNSDFRSRLLDDVYELRAFLLQREAEASAGTSAVLLAGAVDDALQQWMAPGAGVQALSELGALLEELTGQRISQLLMLQGSECSTNRLVAALQRQAGKEAKFRRAAEEVEAKRRDILRSLAVEAPKLTFTQKRTSLVKVEVEAALAKAFNGRQVNIIGEINNVLL